MYKQLSKFLLLFFSFNVGASDVFIILKNLRNNPVSIYEESNKIATIDSQNVNSKNPFDMVKIFKYNHNTLTLLPDDPDEIMAEMAGWRDLIPNIMREQSFSPENIKFSYKSGWSTYKGSFDQFLIQEEQAINTPEHVIIQYYVFDQNQHKKYTFMHEKTLYLDRNETPIEIAELIFFNLNLDPDGIEKIKNSLM